jgi:hypothetical protein
MKLSSTRIFKATLIAPLAAIPATFIYCAFMKLTGDWGYGTFLGKVSAISIYSVLISYVGLLLLGTLPAVVRRNTAGLNFYKIATLILLLSLLLNLFGKGGNFDTFFMLSLYSCSVAWAFWYLLNQQVKT